MNTPPDHDPDKHGERGAVAGRPTSPAFGSPEFDAETRALVVPRRTETPVARLSQATLDECRRVRLMAQARREYEQAMAEAPAIIFTEADVEAMAARDEAVQEGRHADPFGRNRVNPHD